MTITEFGAGYGCIVSSRPSINSVNVSVQNDPSTMLQCKMPSRESAGRTEKLYDDQQRSEKNTGTNRRPRMKNALRCALVPLIDQARPRYVVRRSTELSSTKTSCLASYMPILAIYSRRFCVDCSAATRVI